MAPFNSLSGSSATTCKHTHAQARHDKMTRLWVYSESTVSTAIIILLMEDGSSFTMCNKKRENMLVNKSNSSEEISNETKILDYKGLLEKILCLRYYKNACLN